MARAIQGNPGCSRCGGSGVQSFIPKRGPLAGTVQMGACIDCFAAALIAAPAGAYRRRQNARQFLGAEVTMSAAIDAAALRPTLDAVRDARRRGEGCP